MKRALRLTSASAACGLVLALGLGCPKSPPSSWPPPSDPCPTQADVDRLTDWIGARAKGQKAAEIMRLRDELDRWFTAASYCQEAEERLAPAAGPFGR